MGDAGNARGSQSAEVEKTHGVQEKPPTWSDGDGESVGGWAEYHEGNACVGLVAGRAQLVQLLGETEGGPAAGPGSKLVRTHCMQRDGGVCFGRVH